MIREGIQQVCLLGKNAPLHQLPALGSQHSALSKDFPKQVVFAWDMPRFGSFHSRWVQSAAPELWHRCREPPASTALPGFVRGSNKVPLMSADVATWQSVAATAQESWSLAADTTNLTCRPEDCQTLVSSILIKKHVVTLRTSLHPQTLCCSSIV